MSDLLGFYPALVRRGVFNGVDLKPLVERFWRLESMRIASRACTAPEPSKWRTKVRYYDRRQEAAKRRDT